jgi:hypothetical protein
MKVRYSLAGLIGITTAIAIYLGSVRLAYEYGYHNGFIEGWAGEIDRDLLDEWLARKRVERLEEIRREGN